VVRAVPKEQVVAAHLSDVTAILRALFGDSELELEQTTRLDDVSGWDSMDIVAVVVEFEYRFGVQFELAEIDRLITVGDLLHMIVTKQALVTA
jgi:acyl carrier protein